MGTLKGNVFPNYCSDPSRDAPAAVPPPAYTDYIRPKISRCLQTQKQTEQDRGHPEI